MADTPHSPPGLPVVDAGLSPGQTVRYVVADADGRGASRVRLPFEESERYDAEWYETAALRAVESVLSPVGWRRADIERYLAERTDSSLARYLE
jgi:DNA polymerase I